MDLHFFVIYYQFQKFWSLGFAFGFGLGFFVGVFFWRIKKNPSNENNYFFFFISTTSKHCLLSATEKKNQLFIHSQFLN